MEKSSNKKLLIFLAVVMVLVGGVWYWQSQKSTQILTVPDQKLSEAERTIVIGGGTQGEYGGLRIGVGFVGLGEVVLESGVHEQHRVADLWLYYRDDSSKNTKVQVHIGQRVTIGKYAFLVTDMRGGKGSVELQFETDP